MLPDQWRHAVSDLADRQVLDGSYLAGGLDTIGSRGARRDFVDLYVAAQTYGLQAIFEWFEAKYASAPHNRAHVLKALTYFVDAEHEPMPDMLVPIEWSAVTAYFVRETPRLVRLT